ncbi:Semaphorin-5B-like [Oopsacas minuta]|uniref:Semaphorin-5B-like n=1 Tax=Oopsacas minuta TaxID=111878 RepID=A0AAV7IX59_9METZ|nr:Semaphorin-5B-like [Oopsacas minuta]
MFILRYICVFVYLDLVYANFFYPVTSPDRIILEESNVIVGARNLILRINSDFTEISNFQDVTPSDSDYNQCIRNGWPSEYCHNDFSIMLIPTSHQILSGTQRRQNETIFTCSTNAYSPQCSFRDVNTFEAIHSFNGDNYISSENQYQSADLFTNTGDLFTFRQEGLGEDYVISKHLLPLSSDSLIRTRKFFQTSLWLNEAQVVSMYQEGNFVYIFLREKAVEVSTRISQNVQIYSRVARICKNDLGSGGEENHFLSFQKARISCVYQQTSQTPPYHYNELQDTYKFSGAFEHNTLPFEQVYAIFSSPLNGPVGSAVCVYTFDKNDFDLVKAFRGRYITEESAYSWGFSSEKGDINCEADPIRTTEEARRDVIMQFSVRQAHQPEPLFHLNNQKFVKIVVDSVVSFDGVYTEVMFILAISYESTIDIMLHRVNYNSHRSSSSHLISTTMIVKDTTELFVTEMKLYKNMQKRSQEGIIVGTKSGIHKIPLQSCFNYNSAEECVESMDPYCVFSCKQQQCVSIYNVNKSGDHFLYNYTTGEVWDCPPQYKLPDVTVSTNNGTLYSTNITSPTINTTAIDTTTLITMTTDDPIDLTDNLFPLIPLPPIFIEYLIVGVLLSSTLFCCLGVLITLFCIKISIYARKLKKLDYHQTETNTFGSDEGSPPPRQFWEPTAMPYEVPLNGHNMFSRDNLSSYKPSHMQSSPSIGTSHSLAYSFQPRNWSQHPTHSLFSEPLIKNKYPSSTLPRSHSTITNLNIPPLPVRVNSKGILLHPPTSPSPSSFHHFNVSNKYKQRFPEIRAFTPDFPL